MMLSPIIQELRNNWFPNVSDSGLERVIDLLESGSPLLINGAFVKAMPMGCLATHIAWHHAATCDLNIEAGVTWLTRVAGLNPATSHVIKAWDNQLPGDFNVRAMILNECKVEKCKRESDCSDKLQKHQRFDVSLIKG